MARTKGSKNAADNEFVYDDSDELYGAVMSGGAVAAPVAAATSEVQAAAAATPHPNLIFLVEGKVRLDQLGDPAVFSDQRRIVSAANIDEALAKFVAYFESMSNDSQRYTVVQAGGSETIL